MNRMGIRPIYFLAALLAPISAQAQSYWKLSSQADGIQLIRNFEGDQTLQPAMEPLNFDSVATIPHNGPWRDFDCGVYKYSLDCYSNDTFWRIDSRWGSNLKFYGAEDASSLAPTAMSQASAQQIAYDYMQTHFPEPRKLTLLHSERVKNLETFVSSCNFFYCQDVGNGVRGPASCEVDVDTIYGRIILYRGVNRPVLCPTTPSLSADQAIGAALAAFAPSGDGTFEQTDGVGLTTPDEFGNETIAYAIILSYPSVEVSVDGFTGQILAHLDLSGSSSPDRKAKERTQRAMRLPKPDLRLLLISAGKGGGSWCSRPPVLLDNQAYLASDYLRCGDRSVKVSATADHMDYTVVTPHHSLTYTIGKTTYTLDGARQSLKHSPALVLGQPYVPLELAEKLMPYHLTYLPATKTVHFEAIPQKTASASSSVKTVSAH